MGGTGDELRVYIPPWKRDRREKIRRAVRDRGIQYLVHFTQLDNVPSILEHGLLSRRKLDKREIEYELNDENRFDQALGAISLSISFPNYKMFSHHRNKGCNAGVRWAVLLLRRDLLWKTKCTYHYTNAASKDFRHKRSQDLKSLKAFERMFTREIEGKCRDPRIPPSYTTDPQAEVLVFQWIPADRITAVHIEKREDRETLIEKCKEQNIIIRSSLFKVCDRFFKPRQDWRRWQKQKDENQKDFEQDDEDVPF